MIEGSQSANVFSETNGRIDIQGASHDKCMAIVRQILLRQSSDFPSRTERLTGLYRPYRIARLASILGITSRKHYSFFVLTLLSQNELNGVGRPREERICYYQ
jgi:hypothetical protein